MKVEQAAPDVGGIVNAIIFVVVVLVAGWLLLAWAIVKRPILALPVAAFTGLVVLVGMHDAQALTIYAFVGLWIWRRAHKRSFDRVVGRRMRNGWRRRWVYERRWRNTMLQSGLAKRTRVRESVPKIQKVTSTVWCDRVLVRMVLGQCTEDYEKAAPGLAHSFGAEVCRVREDRPGRLWLQFRIADPLVAAVPALPVCENVDLEAVPIGLQEDGEPWRVKLLGTHVLIVGATGAGKGSVLQSLIRALGPEIRDGRVQLRVVDPKGGMELGPGRPLYARFAKPTLDEQPYADIVTVLEDAVDALRRRSHGLGDAGVRKHTPTSEQPLIVVVIDELADLTKYVKDRKLKERIERALGLLLTQGRAVGITVVAALQNPRKEVINDRDLFPTRIALRLDESGQVDMVLGEGARDRGALCDKILNSQPGVAYVHTDGIREPTRVRAAYPTNDDIKALVADYTPHQHLDGEQLFQAAEHDVDAEIIELPTARDEQRPEGNGERQAS
jgi:S-DNA-T family DNA segregation ATPase FtsK/SpoIIIE